MFSNAGKPRMLALRVAKFGDVPMTHAFWKVPWLVEFAPVLANTPADPVPGAPLTTTAWPTSPGVNGAEVAQAGAVGLPAETAPSVTICPSPTAPTAVTENSHG